MVSASFPEDDQVCHKRFQVEHASFLALGGLAIVLVATIRKAV